jgi:hypothetical protein
MVLCEERQQNSVLSCWVELAQLRSKCHREALINVFPVVA